MSADPVGHDNLREEIPRVQLGHGSGGRLSAELIDRIILPSLASTLADRSDIARSAGVSEDAAILELDASGGSRIALTTDSFVVRPLFFPGGDIGDLAVNGTVNDLAVMGAVPRYLTLGLIIEEGLPLSDLSRILQSIERCALAAGVAVVAGDTKVVERGAADGLYINTAGVGAIPDGRALSAGALEDGDLILVSGPVGDHGTAVISRREGLAFETEVVSDTAPVHRMTEALLCSGAHVRAMRDPTRGGLATTVTEWALASGVSITLNEDAIPVSGPTLRACELLGLDPYYVANEGRIIAAIAAADGDIALAALKSLPEGADAAIIGTVRAEAETGEVTLRTRIGGRRFLDMLPGEQLPRIC